FDLGATRPLSGARADAGDEIIVTGTRDPDRRRVQPLPDLMPQPPRLKLARGEGARADIDTRRGRLGDGQVKAPLKIPF
ncbi:hypothetical protein, partial [Polymorphobacter multimanifer]|uniref:hypothetical protein n=1 Tax=Polymorphobacter multimanifer TaxID=1070431 RepID=UPI00166E9C02